MYQEEKQIFENNILSVLQWSPFNILNLSRIRCEELNLLTRVVISRQGKTTDTDKCQRFWNVHDVCLTYP